MLNTNLSKFEIKNSSSVYQDKKESEKEHKEIKSFNLPERSIHRSKSVVGYSGNAKKSNIETQSGKKLDDEITKIEAKIRQF